MNKYILRFLWLVKERSVHRFARIDSRESIHKKKLIFGSTWPDSRGSCLLSDSHSNSRDSRPVLAAIHFLEGRFAKTRFFFFSKRETIRRDIRDSRANRESIRANRPTKLPCHDYYDRFEAFSTRSKGTLLAWPCLQLLIVTMLSLVLGDESFGKCQ